MLKKVIALVIISIALFYLGIPRIVSSFGPAYLSDSFISSGSTIEVTQLDIDYPSASNLFIERLVLVVDTHIVAINNMQINYVLDELLIESISIQLAATKQENSHDMSLPELPVLSTEQLLASIPDLRGTVKQIVLNNDKSSIRVESLSFDSKRKNHVKFKANEVDLSGVDQLTNHKLLKVISTKITVTGELSQVNDKLIFQVNNEQFSMTGQYSVVDSDSIVELTLQQEMIQKELVSVVSEKIKLSSPIQLTYRQPADHNAPSSLELNTVLKTDTEVINDVMFNAKLTEAPESNHLIVEALISSEQATNGTLNATAHFAIKPYQQDWQLNNFAVDGKISNWQMDVDNYQLHINASELMTVPQSLLLSDLLTRAVSLEFTANDNELIIQDISSDQRLLSQPVNLVLSVTGKIERFNDLSLHSKITISDFQHKMFKPSTELSVEANIEHFNLADSSVRFNMTGFNLTGMLGDYQYDSIYTEASGNYSNKHIYLTGKTLINGGFSVPYKATYDISNQVGDINFPEHLNQVTSLNRLLSQMTKDAFEQSNFTKVTIRHRGKLKISIRD